MIARKANTALSPPIKGAPPGWLTYHGPHGGTGWKNALTGKIIYATSGRSPFKGGRGGKGAPTTTTAKVFAAKRRANAMALARWYASDWNLREELGLQVPAMQKHEAGLELYGSGISLWRDEKENRWKVIRVHQPQPAERQPQQFMFNPSQARVPAGSGAMNIGGREFHGGEWVPKEFENMATPAQKQAMHGGHRQSAEGRMAKGPVDVKGLRTTIGEHVSGEGLGGQELRDARQAYRGMMKHHGPMLVNRISELVGEAKAVLESVPEGAENAEHLKVKMAQKLEAYGHMLDWAAEHGMTPTPSMAEGEGEVGAKPDAAAATDKVSFEGPLADKMNAALERLPAELRPTFAKAASDVMGRMGERARNIVGASVKTVEFHASGSGLVAGMAANMTEAGQDGAGWAAGKSSRGAAGVYYRATGHLGIDGSEPNAPQTATEAAITSHEIGHAIDGPRMAFSGDAEWRRAYGSEIAGGQLSRYAATPPPGSKRDKYAEGFAEFSRILHSGDKKLDDIKAAFPKSHAFWEQRGLLPKEAAGGAGAAGAADQGAEASVVEPQEAAAEVVAEPSMAGSDDPHATIADAVTDHGPNNLVPMAVVRKKLAADGITDKAEQDRAIRAAIKDKAVSPVAFEGRFGSTPEERESFLRGDEDPLSANMTQQWGFLSIPAKQAPSPERDAFMAKLKAEEDAAKARSRNRRAR